LHLHLCFPPPLVGFEIPLLKLKLFDTRVTFHLSGCLVLFDHFMNEGRHGVSSRSFFVGDFWSHLIDLS
jgi:hypothetical protein